MYLPRSICDCHLRRHGHVMPIELSSCVIDGNRDVSTRASSCFISFLHALYFYQDSCYLFIGSKSIQEFDAR